MATSTNIPEVTNLTASVATVGSLAIPSLVTGSVLIAGVGSTVNQDTPNFTYDSTNQILNVANCRFKGSPWCDILSYGASPSASAATNAAAINSAIAAVLALGGGIIFIPPGTYAIAPNVVTLADCDTAIIFSRGSTFTMSGSGWMFKLPDGLTTTRRYVIDAPKIVGASTAGQVFLNVADSNSRAYPVINDPNITGIEVPIDITAGELAYVHPVEVRVFGGKILAPNLTTALLARTPSLAGTYAFGCTLYIRDTFLYDYVATPGWGLDFDGDLICSGIIIAMWYGACKLDGLQGDDLEWYTAGGAQTWEVKGGNYWSTERVMNLELQNIVFTISSSYEYSIVDCELFGSTIVVNARKARVRVRGQTSLGIAAIIIDITASGTQAEISGTFPDATNIAIRTASTGGSFHSCKFASTGTHKTFVETGGANSNILVGCTGISSGGGFVKIGAQSIVDTTIANIA